MADLVQRTEPCQEVDKSQQMRLADVFVFGPFMIAAALMTKPPPVVRWLLGGLGATTILYNLYNYRKTAEVQGSPAPIKGSAWIR